MNGMYIQAVLKDREREIDKHVERNQFYKHNRVSVTSQQDAAEKSKNGLSLMWLSVINHLGGIFA